MSEPAQLPIKTTGHVVPPMGSSSRPDDVIAFSDTRLHTTTAIFDVRISEVAELQADDTFAILVVSAAPW